MTKLLVVIGITGQQGGSVATTFASLPDWRVRGITRNAASPASLLWTAKGVEMVAGDLSSPSSLTAAFAGATAIFSTTDFWAAYYNPYTQSLLAQGQTLGEYCMLQELQQGRNVADAASNVVGLERIVVSSLCDVREKSGGKYGGVYHWDGKARAVKYLNEAYPALAAKLSVVLVGNYMSNWKKDVKLRKQKDGSYRLGLVGSGVCPLPHLDVEDDLGKIVQAVLSSPPRKTVLAGDMVSYTHQLKTWCNVNKVPVGGFDALPIDVFDRFFPIPGLGRELGEMMAFMDEFGYAGGDPDVVFPSELETPCSLTTWDEYVKKQDWSKHLSA